jgi:hypothetical protein
MTDSEVASESYVHYLTQWKIVGNSEVHTDPFLTSWKVSGNSEVHGQEIWSCGDYSDVDGKYHIKISNGVAIFDIALTEPLRKVNDVVDTIEFPSNIEGNAMVTRNVESKTVNAYNDADGNQVATTLPNDTILHIQNLYDYTQTTKQNIVVNNISQRNAEIKISSLTGANYFGFNISLQRGNYYSSCLFKNEDAKPNIIYSDSGNSSTVKSSEYEKVSLLKSNASVFRYSALNNPSVWQINDVFFVKDVNVFDINAMFADCTNLKPASESDFEALFPNLGCIDRTDTAIDVIVKDGKLYKEDETGIEILVPLSTPTTELIDAPQIAVSPTDTYTSANEIPYSAFEHTENNEIWSCGEYNPTDGKYHILVQPLGGSIADIALTEPLRKVNDVADTIEFADGVATLTRNLASVDKGTLNYRSSAEIKQGVFTTSLYNCKYTYGLTADGEQEATIGSGTQARKLQDKDWCFLVRTSDSTYFIITYYAEYATYSASKFAEAMRGKELIYELATPTTELVDAPQIEEAESYSMVISQGGKAVGWSSFDTE